MSDWISVEDAIPHEGVRVLAVATDEDGKAYIAIMRNVHHYGRGRDGRRTWIDDGGDDSTSYGLANYGVTHWRALPCLPTERPTDTVNLSGLLSAIRDDIRWTYALRVVREIHHA